MDSSTFIKFNFIFSDLFPEKDACSSPKPEESRFGSFFKHLQSHAKSDSLSSSKETSERSSSPSSSKEGDVANQWALDLNKILSNEDTRTTLMIKNIPNKFSREKMLSIINEKLGECFDMFILPTDSNGAKNFGYGFINLKSSLYVVPFYKEFHGSKWAHTKSEKICEISYSKLQGQERLLSHYSPKHIYINQPFAEVKPIAQVGLFNHIKSYGSNPFFPKTLLFVEVLLKLVNKQKLKSASL